MRKKQYISVCALLAGLWGFTGNTQGLAQTAAASPETANKQAKVKIIKKENGQYFELDTTFSVAAGQNMEQFVKEWQKEGSSLKQLGGKPLQTSALGNGEVHVFKYSGPGGKDSVRTVFFRSLLADSLLTHLRAQDTQKVTQQLELLRGAEGGHPIMIKRILKGDSLTKLHRIFLRDSAFMLKTDSFLLKETIRIEKDGKTGAVKVLRPGGDGTVDLLETGDYEVTRMKGPHRQHIIIMRPTKPAASPGLKAEPKAQKTEPLHETAPALSLQVFPNPTSGQVSYSFHAPKKAKAKMRVVNSLGQTVLQRDLGLVQGAFSQDLNLSKYGKGMYVLQLQVGTASASGKILVE